MARGPALKLKAAAAEERNWEIEADLRALRRADEIRNDKARMTRIRAFVEKEQTALKGIAERSKRSK